MKNITLTLAVVLSHLTPTAFAHDGHGLVAAHWHSTDVLGFVAVAVLALAVYFGKK